jgi:deoxycytidylate deaminase
VNKKTLNRLVDIAHGIELESDINPRTRHYAFILNKKRILSIGCNSLKSHPKLLQYGYRPHAGVHAELSALIRSDSVLHSNNKLVTFRFDKSGNLNNGKPCIFCQRALNDAGMKEVWYSCKKGRINRL